MGLSTWWSGRKAGRLHEEGMRLAKERDWERAEAALRQAVELRTAALGPEDPSTLRSRGQRAAVLRRLDRTDEGVAELDACVATLTRTLDATAWPVVEMRLLRCQVLHKAGRPAEAEADARFLAELSAGRSTVLHARSVVLLGHALNALGRHEDAAAAFAAPMELFDAAGGPGRSVAQQLRAHRIQALLFLGRFAEAEALAGDILSARRGADPDQLKLHSAAASGLVFALCGLGRPEEAEQVAHTALDAPGIHGMGQFRAALRLNLARSLHDRGRFEEALAEVETARAEQAVLPDVHATERSATEAGAAAALLGLDRPAEAEAAAVEAVEVCRAALGPAHHQRLRAEHLYAVAVDRQGRHDEAAPLLADNHAAWLAAFGADHPGTVAAAAALSACGRTEGAAPAGG